MLRVGGRVRTYIYDSDPLDKTQLLKDYYRAVMKRHYEKNEYFRETYTSDSGLELERLKQKFREVLFIYAIHHIWIDINKGWAYVCPCRVVDNEVYTMFLSFCL